MKAGTPVWGRAGGNPQRDHPGPAPSRRRSEPRRSFGLTARRRRRRRCRGPELAHLRGRLAILGAHHRGGRHGGGARRGVPRPPQGPGLGLALPDDGDGQRRPEEEEDEEEEEEGGQGSGGGPLLPAEPRGIRGELPAALSPGPARLPQARPWPCPHGARGARPPAAPPPAPVSAGRGPALAAGWGWGWGWAAAAESRAQAPSRAAV